MHEFVSFNHRILRAENAFLPAASSAALYGKGIFTTIAVHGAIPFLWEKHWQRLTANSQKVGIGFSGFSEKAVLKSLLETIDTNRLTHGRARLTFYDETPSFVWQTDSPPLTSLLIQTGENRLTPETFRLTVSPFQINSTAPLAGVKSCNYLENILALEDAKAKGFDEAIRLNEKGEVVSACLANVFWKKSGRIFTPPLKTGCMEGTTRGFVSENFAVEERTANLAELIDAEEVFLTSAGIGIVSGVFNNIK